MRRVMLGLICVLAPLELASGARAADLYGNPYPPAAAYAPPPEVMPAPAPYFGPAYYYLPPPAAYDPRPRIWPTHPPAAFYNGPPPVYWAPPPRPTSCGQYRYWNGDYCADARFSRPYVGPRW